MIQQTVALPCYNGKHIGWLAMEGLCGQQPPPHDWELLVCEEPHDGMLGEEFFNGYSGKLLAVGCKRIKYIALDKWIPLPQKWKIMGESADENSKSFLLHAIDCYSPSKRLITTHDIIAKGYEWVGFSKGYFYSFAHKKLILYSRAAKGLNMGIKTSLVRNIPHATINKNIDGFLFKSLGIQKKYNVHELHGDSLDTDGFNNISKQRIKFYDNPIPPFQPTNMTIDCMALPANVKDRIKAMHAPKLQII